MTHDPLCGWSTPCIHGEGQKHSRDTENSAVPDATYCWMCGADCQCALIAEVIAAAVQRVEVLYSKGHFIWDDGSESYGIPHKRDVMTAIKGDQP